MTLCKMLSKNQRYEKAIEEINEVPEDLGKLEFGIRIHEIIEKYVFDETGNRLQSMNRQWRLEDVSNYSNE